MFSPVLQGPGEFDNDWSPMLTALSLWLTGHVTKDILLFGVVFFFKHLFLWLHWILVAVCRIFDLCCGMRDL